MSDNEIETENAPEPEPENEPEPEQGGESNPDAEPSEQIDGDDEPDDEAESGDEAEQESQAVQDEKALAKRDQKLDAENVRHAKRVSEIMEEGAVDLIPCPVCMDGIAGWVYSPDVQALSEDAVLRLRQLIGLSGLDGITQATFAAQCPACDGNGEVRTGSRVPGYETTTCERCKKTGWIRTDAPTTDGHVEHDDEAPVTGPTVYFPDAEDIEVRNLRERGFTVIPPMQVANG
jgi:hypothetical protein